jgi:hypothetical protein
MTTDVQIVQRGIIGKGSGYDHYIFTDHWVDSGAKITISDTGSNNLHFVFGFEIVSSMVTSNAFKLTLSNGAEITVLDAANYDFSVGGDPLLGDMGFDFTYQDFASEVLGVEVPFSGVTTGGEVKIDESIFGNTINVQPDEVTNGTELTEKSVAVSITDVTPDLTVAISPSLLTNLESTIGADLNSMVQRTNSFYTNEQLGGISQKAAMIDFKSFGALQEDVQFSSSGIVLQNSQGYQLDFAFSNFSPTSLQSFDNMLSEFGGSRDIGEIAISGGFESVTLYEPTSSDVVVQLAHTSTGIEWRNPSSFTGDVDTFVIEGSFDNQIGSYFSVFSALQEAADPQSGSIEDQTLLGAVNSFFNLVGFEGFAAKVGDDVLVRIGDVGTPENGILEIFVAGETGDHEIILGILELSDDDLILNFSYDYDDEQVLSVEASELLRLDSLLVNDLWQSAVVAGYSVGSQSITEVSDQQERVVLQLIDININDFAVKQQEVGGDIRETVELYFPTQENDILSPSIF